MSLPLFIAHAGNRAAFHAARAGDDEERGGQRACRIFRLRHVRQEGPGIDVGAESASRGDHRHACGVEVIHEVFDERGRLADHRLVGGFAQADGHGFDFAHRHAAVGEETFVKRNQVLHLD
jgi:hypothetical protein